MNFDLFDSNIVDISIKLSKDTIFLKFLKFNESMNCLMKICRSKSLAGNVSRLGVVGFLVGFAGQETPPHLACVLVAQLYKSNDLLNAEINPN
ncbi:MAG: hypothetical protein IPH88_03835 [Bacteroidales bacterium]|nr:hypothetical protein [Bacteroidales bacterium]